MKAIILGNSMHDLKRVYVNDIIQQIKSEYVLTDNFLSEKDLENGYDCTDVEIIFSTWGMPAFTKDEIKKYFPKVKYLYYAAGSVQSFAQAFLECNVRVFSSWKANAIPVAEYTFAQILLASKGYFKASKRFCNYLSGKNHAEKSIGNYGVKIGLLGVGGVGSLVAERLKSIDCQVYAYDPYMSKERAKELNVTPVKLDWLFENCNVISNHLANKAELNNFVSYKLLKSMPKYSVFINTGRGAQVNEFDLFKVLIADKTKYAVLDVTKKEPIGLFNPLRLVNNKVLTPHIAGSTGNEVVRMSRLMVKTSIRVNKNEVVDNEVTLQMLKTMA